MEASEPPVELTDQPLPPDSPTLVWLSYINDKEASFLRDHHLPLKSPRSLRSECFTPLRHLVHFLQSSLPHRRERSSALHNKWGKVAHSTETLVQTCPFGLCSFDSEQVSRLSSTYSRALSWSFPPLVLGRSSKPHSPLWVPHTPISTELFHKITFVFAQWFGLSFLCYWDPHSFGHWGSNPSQPWCL